MEGAGKTWLVKRRATRERPAVKAANKSMEHTAAAGFEGGDVTPHAANPQSKYVRLLSILFGMHPIDILKLILLLIACMNYIFMGLLNCILWAYFIALTGLFCFCGSEHPLPMTEQKVENTTAFVKACHKHACLESFSQLELVQRVAKIGAKAKAYRKKKGILDPVSEAAGAAADTVQGAEEERSPARNPVEGPSRLGVCTFALLLHIF